MKLQTLACVLFLSSVPMVATAQPLNDQCLNATPVGEGTFPWDNTGTLVDGPIDCAPGDGGICISSGGARAMPRWNIRWSPARPC
jgi:hypothetical protein